MFGERRGLLANPASARFRSAVRRLFLKVVMPWRAKNRESDPRLPGIRRLVNDLIHRKVRFFGVQGEDLLRILLQPAVGAQMRSSRNPTLADTTFGAAAPVPAATQLGEMSI